jgi:replicative DNA helicase
MRSSIDSQPLPHNRELEFTIIGTSLVDKIVLSMAIEQLRDDDFYLERCRDLFVIMKNMVQSKIPVDLITLDARLETVRREDLRELVEDVSSNIGTIENCEGYIELLAQEGVKRRLIIVSNEIQRMCYDFDSEFQEIVTNSENLIQGATTRACSSNESNMTEVMSQTVDRMNDIHKGVVYGVTTGFQKLDEEMCGFEPGHLIFVAGRPSMGKTALVTAMALNMAINHQIPVSFFSLETTKVELGMRMLSQWSEVNLLQLRKGVLPTRFLPQVYEKTGILADAPIQIDDNSGLTIGDLRSKLRKHKSKYGTRICFIDYLQLMSGSKKSYHAKRDEVVELSRGLKATAKDLKIPIVVLSQLSRESEKRGNKGRKPILSDLKESGSIEEDAEVVLFVHREWYYDKEKGDENKAEIIIAKQKNGPTDTVELYFKRDCAMFFNEARENW